MWMFRAVNLYLDPKKIPGSATLFVAELDEEIKDLQLKQERRDHSLNMSKEELKKDNVDLITFISLDNKLKNVLRTRSGSAVVVHL